jgi:hypothetical protein
MGGLQHIAELLDRARLAWLLDRILPRLVWTACLFVNGFLAIAMLAILRVLTKSPFPFPFLGPTAYLLFIVSWQKTLAREIQVWVMQSVSSVAMLHSN